MNVQYGERTTRYSGHLLTAIDDEVNVVMGLDMGADDYITKPFRIRELSRGSSPSCVDTISRHRPKGSLT